MRLPQRLGGRGREGELERLTHSLVSPQTIHSTYFMTRAVGGGALRSSAAPLNRPIKQTCNSERQKKEMYSKWPHREADQIKSPSGLPSITSGVPT